MAESEISKLVGEVSKGMKQIATLANGLDSRESEVVRKEEIGQKSIDSKKAEYNSLQDKINGGNTELAKKNSDMEQHLSTLKSEGETVMADGKKLMADGLALLNAAKQKESSLNEKIKAVNALEAELKERKENVGKILQQVKVA